MTKHTKTQDLALSYHSFVDRYFSTKPGPKHSKVYLTRQSGIMSLVITTFVIGILLVVLGAFVLGPRLADMQSREITTTYQRRISFLLVFYTLYFAAAIALLAAKNLLWKRISRTGELLLLMGLNLLVMPFILYYSNQPFSLALNLIIILLLVIVARAFFSSYSYAGVNFYIASCAGIVIGLVWGADFIMSMPVSTLTKVLFLCSSPLLIVKLPSGFLHMLELYDIICREHWHRPRHAYHHDRNKPEPFVCLQVPTYSEPPGLVIQTLDKLSVIDYHNYEVIVIDNNTKDPDLWQPVEQHCQKLGSRFKFLHVDGLKGAKGGALNYIDSQLDPRTEIIGVIDADYQADADFLRTLVGHFDDPKVGFVQTPHDYREWRDNLFLTMCYWEYKIFFHTAMISLNERNAGITVGTMCLVRREALEKAGGWSEWCVTEDSELAIRIHDAGYTSIYVDKTYGRGLIPDSFEGYKKQRYRWTAGPVQEFRHYFRHYVGLSKRHSKFSFVQRLFHMNHGLANVLMAFNIPLMILGVGIVSSMVINKEVVHVPFELWLTATITLFSAPVLVFVLYRVTIRAKIADIIGQAIATKALSHVIFLAALNTSVTGSAAWNRTSKFKSNQSYLSALLSTKEELIIGLSLLLFVSTSFYIFPHAGLSLMLMIGITYVALEYFAAPLMAIIGVWSFSRLPAEHESGV